MSKIKVDKKTISTDSIHPLNVAYDVALFFNSSESRSLTYCNLFKERSLRVAYLVNFDGGENENKLKNLKLNIEQLEKVALNTIVIDLEDIFKYNDNVSYIANKIGEYRYKNCIDNIFIDITGAPLIYSVALTKFLFRLFPVPRITLLNVSGHYLLRGEEQFSEGDQYDMYVPGYYGNPDHSKMLHYVFLLGYEGERSLNIYRENLPDKVSVIIPSPGYDEGNDENTIYKNREFLTEVGFVFNEKKIDEKKSENNHLYLLDISDIESVMKTVEKIYDSDRLQYEIRLVPLGPKSHALGAALAAVFNNDISVMYQVPRRYYMSEVPHGDFMWLYDISIN